MNEREEGELRVNVCVYVNIHSHSFTVYTHYHPLSLQLSLFLYFSVCMAFKGTHSSPPITTHHHRPHTVHAAARGVPPAVWLDGVVAEGTRRVPARPCGVCEDSGVWCEVWRGVVCVCDDDDDDSDVWCEVR